MTIIGERLKKLRKSRGWTLSYVAKFLGLKGHSTYANWEYGTREPDFEMISKIADLYGVSIDYITGRTNELDGQGVNNTEISSQQLQVFSFRLNTGLKDNETSIDEAADKCDVTPQYIEKLIKNPNKLPGIKTLYTLADLIGVSPDYLCGYTEDPQGYDVRTPRPKDMEDFLENEDVMLYGNFLSEEDKEKMKGILAAVFMDAKKQNKRKK